MHHRPARRCALFVAVVAVVASSLGAVPSEATGSTFARVAPADQPAIDLVADLRPGRQASSPAEVVDLGGRAVFTALAPTGTARALWTSDGTAEGTHVLGVPGASAPVVVGDHVYAVAVGSDGVRTLWRSDGTRAGTAVFDSGTGPIVGAALEIVAEGDRLFVSRGESHGPGELWVTDGSPAGTHLVAGFAVGPTELAVERSELWFSASDGVHGLEPWRSDGTAAGTVMVADLAPGASSTGRPDDGYPRDFVAVGDLVYFVATGRSLWVSDGSTSNTRRVRPGLGGQGLEVDLLTPLGDALLFRGQDRDGYGLWTTDGTDAGTALVHRTGTVAELAVMDGAVFFGGPAGSKNQLWRTDGTVDGTRLVASLVTRGGPGPGSEAESPFGMTVAGGRLWFAIGDGREGRVLWSSDGTPAGTAIVEELAPYEMTPTSSAPFLGTVGRPLAAVGGDLYASVGDSQHGAELWSTAAPTTSMPKAVNELPPSLSGTFQVGTTVTSDVGAWDVGKPGATVSYSYEWFVDARRAPGATGSSYVPDDPDLGRSLRVRITASAPGVRSRAVLSSPSTVQGGSIVATRLPRIMGKAQVGSTLTALVGEWSPTPLTYHYRWYVYDQPLPGAYAKTFKLTERQVDKPVTVRVTASRPSLERGTKSSRPSGRVQPIALRPGRGPTVRGKLQVTSTLRVYIGSTLPAWDRAEILWYAGDRVTGDGPTAYIGALDEGQRIRVYIRYQRTGWNPVVRRFTLPGRVKASPPPPGY